MTEKSIKGATFKKSSVLIILYNLFDISIFDIIEHHIYELHEDEQINENS